MYLFIDTLSVHTCILLFSQDRDIIDTLSQDFSRREFEDLPGALHDLLKKNNLLYPELEGIVVLNGPGGFTGTRVTCLVVNSIAFAHETPLYPIDYFSFLSLQDKPYPYCVQANKREVLVQNNPGEKPHLIDFSQISQGVYHGTGDMIAFGANEASLSTDMDYKRFIGEVCLDAPVPHIRPLYIKDPDITFPKQ